MKLWFFKVFQFIFDVCNGEFLFDFPHNSITSHFDENNFYNACNRGGGRCDLKWYIVINDLEVFPWAIEHDVNKQPPPPTRNISGMFHFRSMKNFKKIKINKKSYLSYRPSQPRFCLQTSYHQIWRPVQIFSTKKKNYYTSVHKSIRGMILIKLNRMHFKRVRSGSERYLWIFINLLNFGITYVVSCFATLPFCHFLYDEFVWVVETVTGENQ